MGTRAGRPSPFVSFSPLVLEGLESVNVVGIGQPKLHSDEGLATFDAEHVPRFGFGEEFADRALRQAEDSFTENL